MRKRVGVWVANIPLLNLPLKANTAPGLAKAHRCASLRLSKAPWKDCCRRRDECHLLWFKVRPPWMIPTIFPVHDQLHTLQRACSVLPPTLHPWLAFIIASLSLCFWVLCIFGFIAQLSQQELPCSLFSKRMYHCCTLHIHHGRSGGPWDTDVAHQRATLAFLLRLNRCHLIMLTIVTDEYIWVHSPEVPASILCELEPSVFPSFMHSFPLFLAGMCSDQIPTLFSLNLRLSLADSRQIVRFLENLL